MIGNLNPEAKLLRPSRNQINGGKLCANVLGCVVYIGHVVVHVYVDGFVDKRVPSPSTPNSLLLGLKETEAS